MSKRLRTTFCLLLLFAFVMWQVYTPALTAMIVIFSAIGVWEVMKCAGVKNKGVLVLSTAFGALFPIFTAPASLTPFVTAEQLTMVTGAVPGVALLVVYVLALLLFMLKGYDYTKFEHVTIAFAASLFVPFGLTAMIHFRDLYLLSPLFTKEAGIYILFIGAISAWGTDSGAYLAGKFFGKHKMAPKISPKKTMEGAVGGIVFSLVFNLIAFFLFELITGQQPIPWYLVVILTIPISFLGMMGDLSASVIKRNYGVKDFGKIFPGHGGVMDRADSALFTFSALYALLLAYIKIAG